MATYVFGDIQGCYATFKALIEQIGFDVEHDKAWFAGDLVNRGPSSLEVLRWARIHEAQIVLGNHDVHLLALAAGLEPKPSDTLSEVLTAPDRDELLDWLRVQPFIIRRSAYLMVHAGLNPNWSADHAEEAAATLGAMLGGSHWREAALHLRHGTGPEVQALNCLTRIRMCRPDGEPEYGYKGPPEKAPSGLVPWFELYAHSPTERVLFGHWAALGHRDLGHAVSLDGGCVWGRELVAYRLEDGESFRQSAVESRP